MIKNLLFCLGACALLLVAGIVYAGNDAVAVRIDANGVTISRALTVEEPLTAKGNVTVEKTLTASEVKVDGGLAVNGPLALKEPFSTETLTAYIDRKETPKEGVASASAQFGPKDGICFLTKVMTRSKIHPGSSTWGRPGCELGTDVNGKWELKAYRLKGGDNEVEYSASCGATCLKWR